MSHWEDSLMPVPVADSIVFSYYDPFTGPTEVLPFYYPFGQPCLLLFKSTSGNLVH